MSEGKNNDDRQNRLVRMTKDPYLNRSPACALQRSVKQSLEMSCLHIETYDPGFEARM